MFGKADERVVHWIYKGLATYINKEKNYRFCPFNPHQLQGTIGQKSLKLSTPLRTNRGSPQSNLRLSSAANIVKSLEKPINISEKVFDKKLYNVIKLQRNI